MSHAEMKSIKAGTHEKMYECYGFSEEVGGDLGRWAFAEPNSAALM